MRDRKVRQHTERERGEQGRAAEREDGQHMERGGREGERQAGWTAEGGRIWLVMVRSSCSRGRLQGMAGLGGLGADWCSELNISPQT